MVRQSGTSWTTWAVVVVAFALIGWFVTGRSTADQQVSAPSAVEPAVPAIPAAPEVTVRTGTSAKAPIGAFSIRADRISKQSASLVVSSESKDTYRFKKAMVGQRLMIPSHDGTYYLDIHRIGGGTVTMTMGKQR